MMDLLFTASSLPFVAAVILVLLIGVVEGAALLLGFGFSEWVHHHALDGLGSTPDSWLGWLHVGKVPLLVLLVMLLSTFALIGLSLNALTQGFLGFYLAPLLSVPIALLAALPVVRVTGTWLARVMPKDETSAVLLETLVGHVAVIVNGTARANYPAEAKVKNEQGQTFYIHVEPEGEAELKPTESVLLVKQISGSRFLAISNPRPDIL